MKKQIAITLLAVGLAGPAFAQSVTAPAASPTSVPAPASFVSSLSGKRAISYFIEPSAIYMPSNNGLDDGFGASLSGGVALYENHLLNLEFAWLESDYSDGPGSMQFMPLTIGYQYAQPLGKGFLVRGGVLAGAMFEKSDGQPGISNSSRTAFTYGATLGLDYEITENISVGVSGKWMHVDEVKDLRERDMALIGLNCSVKF